MHRGYDMSSILSWRKRVNHAAINFIRLAHKPWITSGFLRSIKTKNNLYRALVHSRFKNQNAHEKYKKYTNKVTHLLEESKRNYYQSQILSCGNDSKKMWNY